MVQRSLVDAAARSPRHFIFFFFFRFLSGTCCLRKKAGSSKEKKREGWRDNRVRGRWGNDGGCSKINSPSDSAVRPCARHLLRERGNSTNKSFFCIALTQNGCNHVAWCLGDYFMRTYHHVCISISINYYHFVEINPANKFCFPERHFFAYRKVCSLFLGFFLFVFWLHVLVPGSFS